VTEPSPKRARPAEADAGAAHEPEALTQAMRQLLEPMAALAIARGLPFATLDEMLKTAFVDAARAAHPELAGGRAVSRISTATGINRREVSRLTQARTEPAPLRRSPAARVFTSWLSDASLKDRRGKPMVLPRQGPAPSFEALAQSVTRDVHPRSLLDELCRLGMARVEDDRVHVLHDSFVPTGDAQRMLRLLGHNVGDHLRAAVTNVLTDTAPHLEQAIFTDELSQQSLDEFRRLMRTQWKALLDTTVPALQRMIDADRAAGRPPEQRVRIGMYSYHEPIAALSDGSTAALPPKTKAAPKRKLP
jgi:Family of unknown function (DUF6502)